MKINLNIAGDSIKVILASLVIVYYITGLISGLWAFTLAVLALTVLVIFAVDIFLTLITRD